jgi:hypothetical protein
VKTTAFRSPRTLSLKKQSLRVLGTSELAAVAGGIDVDGSGRVVVAPEYLTNWKTNAGAPDTVASGR